jgi:hypothetical protein
MQVLRCIWADASQGLLKLLQPGSLNDFLLMLNARQKVVMQKVAGILYTLL